MLRGDALSLQVGGVRLLSRVKDAADAGTGTTRGSQSDAADVRESAKGAHWGLWIWTEPSGHRLPVQSCAYFCGCMDCVSPRRSADRQYAETGSRGKERQA